MLLTETRVTVSLEFNLPATSQHPSSLPACLTFSRVLLPIVVRLGLSDKARLCQFRGPLDIVSCSVVRI